LQPGKTEKESMRGEREREREKGREGATEGETEGDEERLTHSSHHEDDWGPLKVEQHQ